MVSLYNYKETSKLQRSLLEFNIFKFQYPYLMEISDSTYDHISLDEYRKSCIVPETPVSVYLTGDPAKIDLIVTEELSHEPVTACDFENCSWSTPFCTWPIKFQDRYVKKPYAFTEKGNYYYYYYYYYTSKRYAASTAGQVCLLMVTTYSGNIS